MTHAIRTHGRAVLFGSVLGSLVLAAALASPSSAAVKAPAVKTPAVTGVTAHQIVLGTTTPLTGAAAPGYSEIAPATNAVFKYINAHGGVYGRKIKYIIDNDQYNPTLTVTFTKQLVEQDNIFADVGPLGTPTQLAVQGYLNSHGVPQLFVESGCACWSESQYPDSFGWQPNYIVEGKLLGHYVEDHLGRKKAGFLYQDDEFGLDGVKGLSEEIPAKNIVGEQNYQVANLAAGLVGQVSALKAAGATLVVLYTIPAATALTLLAAAGLDYHPVWIVSSVGSDPPTLAGLLGSFSQGKAGASLLNEMITNAYAPPESQASNAWIKLAKSILGTYEKGYHWDGNSEYGVGLGITTVELLEAAGKNLTRSGLIKTLETVGKTFATPGLVPLTYSKTDHYGYSGSEMVKITDSGKTITQVSPIYTTTNTGPISIYTGRPAKIPALFTKG